jgi:hypothetical protein
VKYEALFTPYYHGGQWALPVAHDVVDGLANSFGKPGVYPVDDRGAFFSLLSPASRNWDQASSIWWPSVTRKANRSKVAMPIG